MILFSLAAGTAGRLYTKLMSEIQITNKVYQLVTHIFANAKDAANQKDLTCINPKRLRRFSKDTKNGPINPRNLYPTLRTTRKRPRGREQMPAPPTGGSSVHNDQIPSGSTKPAAMAAPVPCLVRNFYRNTDRIINECV